MALGYHLLTLPILRHTLTISERLRYSSRRGLQLRLRLTFGYARYRLKAYRVRHLVLKHRFVGVRLHQRQHYSPMSLRCFRS